MTRENLLREIPPVDEVLRDPLLADVIIQRGHTATVAAVRAVLDGIRVSVQGENLLTIPPMADIVSAVINRINQESVPQLRTVINATGVALHTNLGRAPLAQEAVEAVLAVAQGYSNLEYDLKTGKRGSRNDLIQPLLCGYCGCEAALAVNNNAAAILLALATLARGKDVVISRGELVEIGDSFRVPDIMEQSGGRLVEVGTTNRTHLWDYENAITPQTGILLKVHTSNYRVVGFAGGVSVGELSALGRQYEIPVVVDLGSGALLEASEYPFTEEPTVPQILRDGADVVCFSGDKLLGGPQTGILLGKRIYVDAMRKNPLARALRLDKLSLAALEATLRLYGDPTKAKEKIPVLRMICTSEKVLRQRGEQLLDCIREKDINCDLELCPQGRPVGGGAVPAQELAGWAVAVMPRDMRVELLEERLRLGDNPVVARITQGRLMLDPATVEPADFSRLAAALADAFQ